MMHQDTHLPPLEECDQRWGRRADDHLEAFKQLLLAHTSEEMEKYEKIIDDVEAIKRDVIELTNKIDDNDSSSINRHEATQEKVKHLTDSINAFMEGQSAFISAIIRAFPKDDEGKPDYDGHRSAHLSWISDAKEAKEFKRFLRNTILGAAAVGVTSFVAIATWAAFLKGPV
jgi:hypothetical protein